MIDLAVPYSSWNAVELVAALTERVKIANVATNDS